jgi:formamidopyrimidine-DNA glycosylase
MPELPEVEAARCQIEKYCVGRTITKVIAKECGGGPRDGKFDDKIVAEGVKEKTLVAALQKRKVLKACRRGKQLWLELSGVGPALLIHLGMTGSIAINGVKRLAYVRIKNEDGPWPPRFTKLMLELSGGKQLAFADPRRFGKILLRNEPLMQPPLSGLAPDPVLEKISFEDFSSGLSASKLPVKALLLMQERIVAGVGNWMADEMLYHAAVHPATPACALSEAQAKAVYKALLMVCKTSCAVNADHNRFPKNWLFLYRWGKGRSAADMGEDSSDEEEGNSAGKGTKACLPNGKAIEFIEVGGRTTAIVPAVQGKAPGKAPVSKTSSNGTGKRKSSVLSSKRPAAKKRRSD